MLVRFWHTKLMRIRFWLQPRPLSFDPYSEKIKDFTIQYKPWDRRWSRSQNRSCIKLVRSRHEKVMWFLFRLLSEPYPLAFIVKKTKIDINFFSLHRPKVRRRSQNRSHIMLGRFRHEKIMQLWFCFRLWPYPLAVKNLKIYIHVQFRSSPWSGFNQAPAPAPAPAIKMRRLRCCNMVIHATNKFSKCFIHTWRSFWHILGRFQ
jgi:hypothetical protein